MKVQSWSLPKVYYYKLNIASLGKVNDDSLSSSKSNSINDFFLLLFRSSK